MVVAIRFCELNGCDSVTAVNKFDRLKLAAADLSPTIVELIGSAVVAAFMPNVKLFDR